MGLLNTWSVIAPLVKRFWYVGPILAMAIYSLILRGDVAEGKAEIELMRVKTSALENRNQITQSSLDEALNVISQQNLEIEARAKLFAEATGEAKAQLASMTEKYHSTAATVAQLELSALDNTLDPCEVSGVAEKALEGL